MSWRVGVDIGGTFTDVVLAEEGGERARGGQGADHAARLRPRRARGARHRPREPRVAPGDVSLLAHATTVVTNALLEGKGARTALITTRGFRDVLELRRSARASLYDLFQDAPAVLVPRHRRLEVTERVDAQGAVVGPLARRGRRRRHRLHQAPRRPGRRRVPALTRSSTTRTSAPSAPGCARPCPDLPVFLSSRGAARDPRVRAHQHHGRVRLRGPDPRLLPRPPGGVGHRHGLPPPYVMGSSGGLLTVDEGLRCRPWWWSRDRRRASSPPRWPAGSSASPT